MATQNDILTFARSGNPFSVKNLLDYFKSTGIEFKRRSLPTQLRRMVGANDLRKVDGDYFIISEGQQSVFLPYYSEEMRKIAKTVLNSYPLLELCIWSLDDIKHLSHYASNRDVVYVEVDRDAVDGVFNLLTVSFPDQRVFVKPTENEYNYYINGNSAIIVKPLRTEAPCKKDKDGVLHPSIEKIMVDVVSDADFTPWQEYETLRLFDNIFSLYDVSLTKLMRYARRRAKSDRITRLLSEINQ